LKNSYKHEWLRKEVPLERFTWQWPPVPVSAHYLPTVSILLYPSSTTSSSVTSSFDNAGTYAKPTEAAKG
jgi:hypothetical protein